MIFKPEEFRKRVSRAEIPPVLFLVGSDEYLIRDLVDQVKAKVLEDSNPLNAAENWDAKEQPLADIVASADQMAFGGGKKFLVVRNADAFLSDDQVLEPYLQDPCKTSVLIFCLEKLDMRFKCAKTVEKSCTVVTVSEQYEDQRRAEVQRLLERFPKVRLDDEALACLRDWVGDDLAALEKELEKISVAYPDKKIIETADIEHLVFRQETQNIFELVDAIVAKERAKAMDILLRLRRDEGKSALEIFGLLRSQLEKLFLAAEMLEEGKPARTVCQTLRVPPFFCDAFAAKARKAKAIKPARFFSLLYESDRAIKTGLWQEELAAEILVTKICAR